MAHQDLQMLIRGSQLELFGNEPAPPLTLHA
jgi:hypothetical protein